MSIFWDYYWFSEDDVVFDSCAPRPDGVADISTAVGNVTLKLVFVPSNVAVGWGKKIWMSLYF